jgi:hypothetical protein
MKWKNLALKQKKNKPQKNLNHFQIWMKINLIQHIYKVGKYRYSQIRQIIWIIPICQVSKKKENRKKGIQ